MEIIFNNFDLFALSLVLLSKSDAPFKEARGFLISCVRSEANRSAKSILLYNTSVISFKERDKFPISSSLFCNLLIGLIFFLSGDAWFAKIFNSLIGLIMYAFKKREKIKIIIAATNTDRITKFFLSSTANIISLEISEMAIITCSLFSSKIFEKVCTIKFFFTTSEALKSLFSFNLEI